MSTSTAAPSRSPRIAPPVPRTPLQWLANERFFGTYRRQLSLGEGIDATAITATYENGVLTVTIPLAERAKPRKIEVAHGGGQQSIEPTTVDSE